MLGNVYAQLGGQLSVLVVGQASALVHQAVPVVGALERRQQLGIGVAGNLFSCQGRRGGGLLVFRLRTASGACPRTRARGHADEKRRDRHYRNQQRDEPAVQPSPRPPKGKLSRTMGRAPMGTAKAVIVVIAMWLQIGVGAMSRMRCHGPILARLQ